MLSPYLFYFIYILVLVFYTERCRVFIAYFFYYLSLSFSRYNSVVSHCLPTIMFFFIYNSIYHSVKIFCGLFFIPFLHCFLLSSQFIYNLYFSLITPLYTKFTYSLDPPYMLNQIIIIPPSIIT